MDWNRITELALVLLAVLTPQFLLANEIDGDEFGKATTGIALAGIVVAAYRVYKMTARRVDVLPDPTPDPDPIEQEPPS